MRGSFRRGVKSVNFKVRIGKSKLEKFLSVRLICFYGIQNLRLNLNVNEFTGLLESMNSDENL